MKFLIYSDAGWAAKYVDDLDKVIYFYLTYETHGNGD